MVNINERKIALDILMDIKKGVPSHNALQNMASYGRGVISDKRSRSLITRLVYGTLENYLYLDFLISEFTGKPVSKLKPLIATLLEMSVYQLMYMDNIPGHAIVNEAVRIVQNSPQKGLKGFVNGVLRNIARNKYDLPEPSGGEDHMLSLKYSIPGFIIDIIDANPGVSGRIETVLGGLRKKRPVTVRCNTSLVTPCELKERLRSEGVTVQSDGQYPDHALFISGFDSIEALRSFKEGLFYVQDIGSILSGEASGFRPGERVLDLCGAPGGKSIGAALKGAMVEAGDVSEAKADLIRENIRRLRLGNINVNVRDATVFDPDLEEGFDTVICDVPCSGIGIIGRKPDICINLTPEKINDLVLLQRSILETAVRYVKPGGRLIFSTCTINSRENEDNGSFLENKGLKTVFEKQWIPGIDGDTDGFYTKILKK